jgi:hypothetical protein
MLVWGGGKRLAKARGRRIDKTMENPLRQKFSLAILNRTAKIKVSGIKDDGADDRSA